VTDALLEEAREENKRREKAREGEERDTARRSGNDRPLLRWMVRERESAIKSRTIKSALLH